MKSRTALSDIELKLLKLLSQNARAPTRSIANLMNVSEATVRYHQKKLEEKGIIKGYSVIIDPTNIQLPIFVTIGVECEPALTKRVAKAIAKSPNFFLVWVVTGAHNIHAKGAFPSAEEMQQAVSEIMTEIEGIQGYHLSLMFEAIKDPYLLPSDLLVALTQK